MTTGYHEPCCTSSFLVKENTMMQYGVATTLYFKFLKYIICYFFIFSLLSIPMIAVNIASYLANEEVEDAGSFFSSKNLVAQKKNLLGSTVGSIGLDSYMCKNMLFDKPE